MYSFVKIAEVSLDDISSARKIKKALEDAGFTLCRDSGCTFDLIVMETVVEEQPIEIDWEKDDESLEAGIKALDKIKNNN